MKASATAGNGGLSGASSTMLSGSGGAATATVTQTNGSFAEAIAKGGNGDASRNPQYFGLATSNVESHSTVGFVEGHSTAIGGDGAAAMDRPYGSIGGGAIANLTISGTTGATGYVTATAGNTGNVENSGRDERANGAIAYGLVTANSGLAEVSVLAQGGRGGDATGANNAGTGSGAGAYGGAISNDQVRVNLTQIGGDGGNALGTGRGGDGGGGLIDQYPAYFAQSVAHTGQYHISNTGGNGGDANFISGRGGSVSSSIYDNGTFFRNSLVLELNSIGGSGGFAHGGSAQSAGRAESQINVGNSSTTGTMDLTARSIGGTGGTSDGGGSGSGGQAESRIYLAGSGDKVSAFALAHGGQGGGDQNLNGIARNGGNAAAVGFAKGGRETSLYVEAIGGNGGGTANSAGGKGGDANAVGGINANGASANFEIHATGGNGGIGRGTGNGGQAGTATITPYSDSQTSAGNTNVSMRGYVTGGNGGGALGTGNGADGGSINLNNAIGTNFVQGAKSLEVVQSATGGNGGFVSERFATAGKGGDANSSISLSGNYTNSLTISAEAKSGRGGDNLTSTGGAGGNAASFSSATNTGSAIATAQSHAGSGGSSIAGRTSTAGNATSSAISNSALGNAQATATSTSNARSVAEATSFARTANSYATAAGTNGYAKASSLSIPTPSGISGSTYALGSAGPQTNVATMASNQGAAFLHNTAELAAYSSVLSNPTTSPASSFISAQDLNQVTAFALTAPANTQTLATGEFGGTYNGSGSTQSQSIQTVLAFDGSSMLGKELFVGLHDGQMTGFTGGNDSWSFTISSQGSGFLQTWNSTGSLSFADLFHDNLLSLGQYTNLNWQDLILSASWNSNSADDSLSGKFFFSSNVAAVPEPSSIALVSLIAAAFVARKLRRKESTSC